MEHESEITKTTIKRIRELASIASAQGMTLQLGKCQKRAIAAEYGDFSNFIFGARIEWTEYDDIIHINPASFVAYA